MCGIAGIGFGDKPILQGEVQGMCDALYHRGPDDGGYYVSPDVGLGMRRLSIIDLDTGRQPMHNEDRSVWVVFNGEIYNFQTLRQELQSRGHRFATASDTEVIVHSYEEYGTRCVEHFRGMFAFALWDERRRQLMIARDRLGIKPLYYASVNGRLVFASELKAILKLPEIERRLDWRSVSHLFSFLTTPSDASIVAGVKKLEAGHLLTCRPREEPVVRRYWNLESRPKDARTEQETIEELRERLDESVRLRLIADVPLGAFLSGGIDSSAVVATMTKLGSGPVKTFSIGFHEESFTELKYARIVAKQFGADHYEWMLAPDVLEIIEDVTAYLDEPFGDSSAIPTYFVSKLASEYVKVVLSGDGGDELFAGYERYLVEGRERRRALPGALRGLAGLAARHVPEGVRGARFLRHLALEGPDRYVDSCTLFHAPEKQRLFTNDAVECIGDYDPAAMQAQRLARQHGDWLTKLQRHDLNGYLPLDILTKVDRMSMAHSIEARVPLLDHKLVEFAATIPSRMLLRDGVTKYIFRQAMRGILPDTIIDRSKHGFAIPLDRWFRGKKVEDFISDLLFSRSSRMRGIFDLSYVQKLVRMHRQGRNLDLQLWTLISFEMWCRQFLDSHGIPATARTPAIEVQSAGLVESSLMGERARASAS